VNYDSYRDSNELQEKLPTEAYSEVYHQQWPGEAYHKAMIEYQVALTGKKGSEKCVLQ